MDVQVDVVLSRFLFPFAHLADDEDAPRTADVGGTGWSGRGHGTALGGAARPPASSREERSMDGAFAFVSAAGSAADSRPVSSSPPLPLDLVRLASSLWYSELIYASGASGAPTACMVSPPPFVLGEHIVRGASVCIYPSGVVRMSTYGGEAVTLRTAARVRRMLREAYLPGEVRHAAREERRLLRAVFAPAEGEEKEGVEGRTERESAISLAAALAGSEVERVGRRAAAPAPPSRHTEGADATRAARRGRGYSGDVCVAEKDLVGEEDEDADALREAVKIDFMNAVATPCWTELLQLRESFFPPHADVDACADEGGGASGGNGVDMRAEEGVAVRASSVAVAPPAVVDAGGRRTRVNVRGDAALVWWRWFLSTSSAEPSTDGHGTAGSAAAVAGRRVVHDVLGQAGSSQHLSTATLTEAEAESGFWVCEGHRDVSPTSPTAQRFVDYLKHRRRLIAHHVLSFKVNRNARQSSVHLTVEWNTAAPASPAPRATASAAMMVPRVPRTLMTASAPVDEGAPNSAASQDGDGVRDVLARSTVSGAAPRSLKLGKTTSQPTRDGRDGWVTEASAANFFLESTFIAESTAPYGLESTRQSPESQLPSIAPTAGAQVERTNSGSSFTAPGAVADIRSASTVATKTPAKVRNTEPAREQVTCILHSTGRAMVSAGSELAIRQVVEVLILPFLVAKADMVLVKQRAA